jgi:hypothetical protein
MKLFKYVFAILLLIPVFVSCHKVSGGRIVFDTDEVHFDKAGGSRTLHIVEGGIRHMHVSEMSGTDYPPFEGDGETYLKRDWIELSKVVEEETDCLVITVSKNDSSESRYAHIYISYWGGESGTTVKVYQE